MDSGKLPRGLRGQVWLSCSQGQLAVQSTSRKGWVRSSQKNAFSINIFKLMVWGTRFFLSFLKVFSFFSPFLGYILYKQLKPPAGPGVG